MSEMCCKRCGANEDRINGFCSVECEEYYSLEEEIGALDNVILERGAEIDALTARIAELEEQVWDLNLANEKLESAYFADETIAPDGTLKPSVRKLLERLEKSNTDCDLAESHVTALLNRIAELEADSVQIQYICEDELPEGISDEVFSAMYACSTVDFVRVYPYITIDGHKRFLFELPEVQE